MERLFKYVGKISEIGYEKKEGAEIGMADIRLWDSRDMEKAPIRIEAFGPLAEYLWHRDWTDAEERYIPQVWYYDSNLFLRRVEIPAARNSDDAAFPGNSKVIANEDWLRGPLAVFGPQEYIDTATPEDMSHEEYTKWLEWKWEHC